MYTNVGGIMLKELELAEFIKENKLKIVCLTETKLTEVFAIRDYNVWRKTRKDGRGGGDDYGAIPIMMQSQLWCHPRCR